MSAGAVERAFREESGRVLATLIRHLGGDFELAEDALQDALAAASVLPHLLAEHGVDSDESLAALYAAR